MIPATDKKRNFNHNGIWYTIHGDYELAISHFSVAKAQMHQLNLVNVNNLELVNSTKEMDDGTVIRCRKVNNKLETVILAPYESIEKVVPKPEKEYKEIRMEERIVPCIRAKDDLGFVACMSGTFEPPYKWFNNDKGYTDENFYDWDFDSVDSRAIPNRGVLAETNMTGNGYIEKLLYLRTQGDIPSSVELTFSDHDPADGSYNLTNEDLVTCLASPSVYNPYVGDPYEVYLYNAHLNYTWIFEPDDSSDSFGPVKINGEISSINNVERSASKSGSYLYSSYNIFPPEFFGHTYSFCMDCSCNSYISAEDMVNSGDSRSWAIAMVQCEKDSYGGSPPYPGYPYSAALLKQDYSLSDNYSDIDTFASPEKQSFRVVSGNINQVSAVYTRGEYITTREISFERDGCPYTNIITDTEVSTYEVSYKYILNVHGTEYILSEYDDDSPIDYYECNYINPTETIRHYESDNGVLVLHASAEDYKTEAYHSFWYTYASPSNNEPIQITKFDTTVIENGYRRFAHKIEEIEGLDQDKYPDIQFDCRVFLGVIQMEPSPSLR